MTATKEQPCTDTQQTSSESARPSPGSTPSAINSALNKIDFAAYSVSELASNDDLLMLRDRLTFMVSQISTLRKAVDERLIEQNVNATIGTRRIFVSHPKTDKPITPYAQAAQAILNKCGGDWSVFAQAHSVNALKPGACKEILGPELWAEHFETVVKSSIKEVVEVDEKFLPKPKRSKA
jgi:hypothetical protein